MSIARLAGVIARAAAPASRVARSARAMPESAQPAFDAPAAVGAAMLRASVAAAPPAPTHRRGRVAPPTAITSPQPILHRIDPRAPEPAPRTTPQASHAPLQSVSGEVTPLTIAPAAGHVQSAPLAPLLPTLHPPQGASVPSVVVRHDAATTAADTPEAIMVDVTATAPLASGPGPSLLPRETAAPRELPQRAAAARRGTVQAAPPQQAEPVAPAPPPISIGTVEVVIAAPPQRPVPAPRPASDRSFARYAAMRSGRDRAW